MIAFFLIYMAIYCSVYVGRRNLIYIPIFVMVVVAGSRGNVGFDTCEYKEIFSTVDQNDFPFIEPGFIALNSVFHSVVDSPQVFLLFLSFVEGLLLYIVARLSPNPRIFLSIFLGIFYYPLFFSTIRNGLGILIIGVGYAAYMAKRRWFWKPLLFAPFFHFTSLPALILFPRFIYLILGGVILFLIFEVFGISSFIALGMDGRMGVHIGKAMDIFGGRSALNDRISLHVPIMLGWVCIAIYLTTSGLTRYLLVGLVLISGVADFFIGKVGRIGLFALFAWIIIISAQFRSYSATVRSFVAISLLYYGATFTLYPIIFGDTRIQARYGEYVRSEAGNYYIWLFNEKLQCPY